MRSWSQIVLQWMCTRHFCLTDNHYKTIAWLVKSECCSCRVSSCKRLLHHSKKFPVHRRQRLPWLPGPVYDFVSRLWTVHGPDWSIPSDKKLLVQFVQSTEYTLLQKQENSNFCIEYHSSSFYLLISVHSGVLSNNTEIQPEEQTESQQTKRWVTSYEFLRACALKQ